MPKSYDATSKFLIHAHPRDWITLAGLSAAPEVRVLESDLSTVSFASDKIVLVEEDPPYIFHGELQSGPDAAAPMRWLVYNTLAHHRHKLAVQTVVFLLHPRAQHPAITGVYSYQTPKGEVTFDYEVVKVWELPVEQLLKGGLGTLPLAPIAAVEPWDVSSVVAHIADRFAAEAAPEHKRELWTAVRILMGLRFKADFVDQMLKGVLGMEESTTYQEILHKGMDRGFQRGIEEGIEKGIEKGIERGRDEGRLSEARQMLLRIGGRKFGPADAAVRSDIEAIQDLDRLELLMEKVLMTADWDELLQ